MTFADILTIIIFSIGILVVGISFSRSGKNMKSFFAAGGKVPWWINGLSLFMGFFSAGTFVVWGSIAYSHGWVAITIQWTMCLAGLVTAIFIAPKWHRTGALTAAEYITKRLGRNVQKTYTYIFLFISMFTTGSFLYPVGKIVEVSTGLPISTSILILGGVSILYVAVGGLWAVVVTDVLQFIILMAAVCIVVPLSFGKVGGVAEFIQAAPEGFFNALSGDYTLGFIIAFAVYNIFFLSGNWAYVQRYTSVKDARSSRKVAFLFAGLYTFCPILWMLPPMIYRVFNPALSGLGDEGAYLLMCKEALPSGLLGLMLGGMIFATASSLNATLNISAGVFTNDIFKRLRPKSTDGQLMKTARISTIGFGLIAIIVALLIPLMGGIVNVVISVAALTGVPLYMPIIWSLFSKRVTGRSVVFITLLSLAINAFFKFITPWAFNFSFDREQEMIVGVAFPFLCLLINEIYFAVKGGVNRDYEQYKVLMAESKAEREAQSAEEVTEGNEASDKANNFGIKVIGMGIAGAGLVITILGVLSETGRLLVVGVGGLLIVLGAVILMLRKK